MNVVAILYEIPANAIEKHNHIDFVWNLITCHKKELEPTSPPSKYTERLQNIRLNK